MSGGLRLRPGGGHVGGVQGGAWGRLRAIAWCLAALVALGAPLAGAGGPAAAAGSSGPAGAAGSGEPGAAAGAAGPPYLVSAAARDHSYAHWVAADPRSRRYLAVWLVNEQRRRGLPVMARLLGSDGRPLAPPVEVGEGMGVSAAFDAKTRRYLVVYLQLGLVWGRLLDAEGRPLGDQFPVAAYRVPRPQLNLPLVAADGDGLFLVAWSDEDGLGPTGWDVFVQWVSAEEGRPVIKARPALAAERRMEALGSRSLEYDPVNRRFIVMWAEGDRRGLWYRFVHPDGRIGAARSLSTLGVQPSPAIDVERRRLLLSWEDGDRREPHYRLYDLDLRPAGPVRRLPGYQLGVDLPSVSFDPVTGRYLVTWRNDFYRNFFGQWIKRDGSPAGRPFIAADLTGFTQVHFSLPRPGGGFLFTYEDEERRQQSPRRQVVILARTLHPSDRLEPADIRSHAPPERRR